MNEAAAGQAAIVMGMVWGFVLLLIYVAIKAGIRKLSQRGHTRATTAQQLLTGPTTQSTTVRAAERR